MTAPARPGSTVARGRGSATALEDARGTLARAVDAARRGWSHCLFLRDGGRVLVAAPERRSMISVAAEFGTDDALAAASLADEALVSALSPRRRDDPATLARGLVAILAGTADRDVGVRLACPIAPGGIAGDGLDPALETAAYAAIARAGPCLRVDLHRTTLRLEAVVASSADPEVDPVSTMRAIAVAKAAMDAAR